MMNRVTTVTAPVRGDSGDSSRLSRVCVPLWLFVAACAVADLLLHVPLLQTDPFHTMLHESAAQLAETVSGREAIGLTLTMLSLVCSFVFIGAAAVIFGRRQRDPMAFLTSLALLTAPIVIYFNGLEQPFYWESAYGLVWGERLSSFNAVLRACGFVLFLALLYLFPDGKLRPRWAGAGFGLGLITIAIVALADGEWSNGFFHTLADRYWLVVVAPLFFAIILGAFSQLWRYRHAVTPLARRQIRWVVVAFALYALSNIFTALSEPIFGGTAVRNLTALVNVLAQYLSALFIPLALTASVARHRLWDADPLMRRAVIYGIMTAFVVGIYALIVGGVGALTGAPGTSPLLALIATGAVAIAFTPVRDALQRIVNRALFGQRDEPYAVVSRLGQRLGDALAPEAALQMAAHTIGQALKLPFVEIESAGDGARYRYVVDASSPFTDTRTFALTYRGESLGELRVAPRAGERLSDKDIRLLDDLARQAGVALHTARATADLRHSRERIVSAREEERRRLHHDLHDDLGPALASHTLKLDAAIDLTLTDPDQARTVLEELKRQTQTMIADLRRLVYELRPPALDDLGLVGALQSVYGAHRSASLQVSIHVAKPLPPLPAAVEVSAYRIAGEAIANTLHHARAQHCDVWLAIDGNHLGIVIEDDGLGIRNHDISTYGEDGDEVAGVGLRSMRERAEELGGSFAVSARPGGGTRVIAMLPVTY